MTAIIIDDEELARKRIEHLLQKHANDIEIVDKIDNGQDAITQINTLKPHVIFLDIKLLDMTGFDVIQALDEPIPFIIFTTAYADFALQAFETLALDYLVKPIDQNRFDKSILKLKSIKAIERLSKGSLIDMQDAFMQSKPKTTTLSITLGNKILLISFKEISHLAADDKYTSVHLANGKKYLYNKTLAFLESTLPENFVRIHRSYMVNKDHILHIQKYIKGRFMLIMNDSEGTSIISSDGYRSNMKDKLGF